MNYFILPDCIRNAISVQSMAHMRNLDTSIIHASPKHVSPAFNRSSVKVFQHGDAIKIMQWTNLPFLYKTIMHWNFVAHIRLLNEVYKSL